MLCVSFIYYSTTGGEICQLYEKAVKEGSLISLRRSLMCQREEIQKVLRKISITPCVKGCCSYAISFSLFFMARPMEPVTNSLDRVLLSFISTITITRGAGTEAGVM